MFPYFRVAVVLALLSLGLTVQQKNSLIAQTIRKTTATDSWRGKRARLEFQFGQELVKISDWCRNNGLARQISQTHKLKLNRDQSRQYIFLPTDKTMPDPEQQAGELKVWLEKINAAKVAHAERIFELAKEALSQDAAGVAYQLLNEVVYHDRDHAEGRRILDHKLKDGVWHVASNSFRFRKANKRHDYLALGKGQYNTVETAHFKIESTASEQRTRKLAIELELWHSVWRQVFFRYWGSKTTLKASFDGKQPLRIPKRKFDIFFFQNQQQYAEKLEPLVRGIGVSSGYYDNGRRTSFFYDGDEKVQATWRHELTHQLFRESKRRSPANVFDKNYVWLDEGVATYAESMVKLDNYVTLGGFDAERTQFARQHALVEGSSLPTDQLNSMGQDAWKAQARVDAKLYAQSAAIVDMLMNDKRGQHQQDLVELLKIIYPKQAKSTSFKRVMNLSFDQVDQQFLQFLTVDQDVVDKHIIKPETRTFLCLANANLTKDDYLKLGKCVKLEALGLSGHALTAEDLRPLANCPALHTLNLLKCRFEPKALLALAKIPNLTSVNLALSEIGPVQQNEIAQLRQQKPGLVIKP